MSEQLEAEVEWLRAEAAIAMRAEVERLVAGSDLLATEIERLRDELNTKTAEWYTMMEEGKKQRAEVGRLRAIISPGNATSFEEHMAAREAHWVAQVERLRAKNGELALSLAADRGELRNLRAEVERLRAQEATLREELGSEFDAALRRAALRTPGRKGK